MSSTDLIDAIGNKYSAEILCATRTPISAQQLSDELDVPIATCYRRITELVDAGLLECEGSELSEEGRRTDVYRRTIDSVTISFEDEGPDYTFEERSEAKNRLYDARVER